MTFEIAAEDDVDPRDLPLARQALESLFALYPGYAWVAEIPPNQNILKIKNLSLDVRGKYGIVLHKTELSGANIPKTMRVAGGELLERFRAVRGPMQPDDIAGRTGIHEKPDS